VIKKNNSKLIIISIMILGVLLLLLLNGCFLLPRYGSVEGYVYVPESPAKGSSIILRDSSQAPAGYKPLVGATVGVEGSSNTTTTDIYGYFILIDISIGTIIINITPPSGSGYQPLIISVEVILDSIVGIGNDGSVSLPSENADYWDVTINRIDTTNWPEVKVYVQVIDPINNSPIIGASDFKVDINGHEIGYLTVQSAGASASSSSSSLVIDRSGSMSGTKLSDAKDAAKTFVGFMTANDRAEVVSFSYNVSVDQVFTNDKSALYNAIDSLSAGGATSLYDGIWKGLDDTNLEASKRKAVIVLTDGQENWSSSEHGGGSPPDNSDVIGHANDLNIPIYTIGLGLSKGITVEEGVRVFRGFDPAQDLQQIANDTGGKPFDAPTSTDLEYIYVQITQRIQQQYIITFTDNTGVTEGYLTVKLNYNQLYGEDTKEYKPSAQEYENKVEVYGTGKYTQLEVRKDHNSNAELIGKKYWGSVGTVIDEHKEENGDISWMEVRWDNDENVPGETDSYYKPVSGWSEAKYLWEYDTNERVRGVDVSSNNSIEDWGKIYISGRRFAIIKVNRGGGDCSSDYGLQQNIEGAVAADMYISFYHWSKLSLDAEAEAICFDKLNKKYRLSIPDNRYLMPALDVEGKDKYDDGIVGINLQGDEYKKTWLEVAEWVNDWMEKVHELLNLEEDKYPIMYCDFDTAYHLYDVNEDVKNYPLWVVDYGTDENPYYDQMNWEPPNWSFRQYAGGSQLEAGRGRCPGFEENEGTDLDIFNGNIGDLKSEFLIQ